MRRTVSLLGRCLQTSRVAQCLTHQWGLSCSMASNKTRLSQTPGNGAVYIYLRKVEKATLARWLSWLERHPYQKVGGSIPGCSMCGRLPTDVSLPHRRFSFSVSFLLPSSLSKINKHFFLEKVGKIPKPVCSVCPGRLHGVCAVRPQVLTRLTQKTCWHSQGWALGADCARSCTGVAFLTEEQKIGAKG